jgi:hypothetical protein
VPSSGQLSETRWADTDSFAGSRSAARISLVAEAARSQSRQSSPAGLRVCRTWHLMESAWGASQLVLPENRFPGTLSSELRFPARGHPVEALPVTRCSRRHRPHRFSLIGPRRRAYRAGRPCSLKVPSPGCGRRIFANKSLQNSIYATPSYSSSRPRLTGDRRDRFAGISSPLPDSNRRPPPYHAIRTATSRGQRQEIRVVQAGSRLEKRPNHCAPLPPRFSKFFPSWRGVRVLPLRNSAAQPS